MKIAPEVRLIDISHEIPDQDIMAGSWVVQNSTPLFPEGSVHMVVVDPGVGTERKPIALRVDGQFYVGPDNGIFSLLTEDKSFEGVCLTNEEYWNRPTSNTFHGRDIFAPVAAHLSNGVALDDLGEPLDDLETYRWAAPVADKDGLQGWIIHIDKFGNLITNLPASLIDEVIADRSVKIYVGNTILDELVETFGSVPEGEPAAYIGSSGMLEVGINKGDAAEMLGVQKGGQISLVLQKRN